MTNLTYYDVLQITPDADDHMIRRAYVHLAKRHHPDANRTDPQLASARFRLISEAYETLRDPHKRTAYDNTLRAQVWYTQPQNDNVHAASDVFTRARSTLERLMRIMSTQRDLRMHNPAHND